MQDDRINRVTRGCPCDDGDGEGCPSHGWGSPDPDGASARDVLFAWQAQAASSHGRSPVLPSGSIGGLREQDVDPAVGTPVQGRRYVLSLCVDRPLLPGEWRVLRRKVPAEAAGLPICALALLAGADGDDRCHPEKLRVEGRGVEVVPGDGRWYAAADEDVRLVEGQEVALEVRNVDPTRSGTFSGALLLGDWSRATGAAGRLVGVVRWPCQEGGPCTVPSSGGACPGCDYPRAYAHRDSLLDAFYADPVYVRGTAVTVYPDPGVPPGVVRVVRRDGSQSDHAIDESAEPGRTFAPDSPAPPLTREARHPEEVDAALAHASPAQLARDGTSPLAGLGAGSAADLLEAGARLLRQSGADPSARYLVDALVGGVHGLLHGGYVGSRRVDLLREVLGDAPRSPYLRPEDVRVLRPLSSAVRALADEAQRHERTEAVRGASSFLLVDDARPGLRRLEVGPFPRPARRIRVALLPGEAAHVRVYDLQVGPWERRPLGASVVERMPGWVPELVREDGPLVDLGVRVTRRYLPGWVLAGQLTQGAQSADPVLLSASDLLGGAWVDLPQVLPSMGCAYLVYEVAPGHVLAAAIEAG